MNFLLAEGLIIFALLSQVVTIVAFYHSSSLAYPWDYGFDIKKIKLISDTSLANLRIASQDVCKAIFSCHSCLSCCRWNNWNGAWELAMPCQPSWIEWYWMGNVSIHFNRLTFSFSQYYDYSGSLEFWAIFKLDWNVAWNLRISQWFCQTTNYALPATNWSTSCQRS